LKLKKSTKELLNEEFTVSELFALKTTVPELIDVIEEVLI
jgi:hypothetical protein